MNQKRVQCKEAISIAKHLGTRNTRLPKKTRKAEALASVSQLTYSSHELQQENKCNSISMINLSHKNMSQNMYAFVVTNSGSSVL